MKFADLRPGGVYVVKVSGHNVPVKITAIIGPKRIYGQNLKTGKDLEFRSGLRFKRTVAPSELRRIAERSKRPSFWHGEADALEARMYNQF